VPERLAVLLFDSKSIDDLPDDWALRAQEFQLGLGLLVVGGAAALLVTDFREVLGGF